MGEKYNTADPSWKKINWTTKSDGAVNTSNYDMLPFCEVKLEADETLVVGCEETINSESLSPVSCSESDELCFAELDDSGGGTRGRRRGLAYKYESPEERSARLNKMSEYAAKRLATETSDQRASRLKRMSEYAAKRLSQETSEQRAKRLARMSAYAAKRLAQESPEQRQARLARMSAYATRRQAMKKMSHSSVNKGDKIQSN